MTNKNAKGYFAKVRKQIKTILATSETLEAVENSLCELILESYKNGEKAGKAGGKPKTKNPYFEAEDTEEDE